MLFRIQNNDMEKELPTHLTLVKKLIGKKLILEDGRQTPIIIGADFTKNHLKIWFDEKFGTSKTFYL